MVPFEKECGLKIVKELVEGESNLSRIYGFILYTEQDPYVAKVLRDDDFWSALDTISGSNWPIFAVRPLPKGNWKLSPSSRGGNTTNFMVQTWDEPKANIPVLRDFGIKKTEDLPLFVVFMWDDDDNLNEITIPILGNNQEKVFCSLKEIVETIAKVEEAILPQYKGTVNVFRNVKAALEALAFRHTVINRGKILFRLAEFFNLFR